MKVLITILYLSPSILMIGWLVYKVLLLQYKCAYYEQKFRNMRPYLTEQFWTNIDRMMKTQNPFK